MPSIPLSEFTHASFQGHIGIAQIDITPPVGIYSRIWGAAKHDFAESIHRPLTLNVLTIANSIDTEPLILIDADLSWWKSLDAFNDLKTRILDEFSVESSKLIFAVAHTHASPPLIDRNDHLPDAGLYETWMEHLLSSTITAIKEAKNSTSKATLDWHSGKCTLATNRDLPDPDPDRERFICGYNPEGSPDDTLLVGRITDSAGQVRATLVNYACHPTTLAWENTAISPDYLGAMRETIESFTKAPSIFLLGACGELAPRYQYVGDPEVADRHGRELGFSALSVLHGMEPQGTRLKLTQTVESGAPLAVWKHEPRNVSEELQALTATAKLPLKNWPSAEELERQQNECNDRALEERLSRKLKIRRSLGNGSTYDLPIYVWQIGEAILVGSCCEAYSLLQQELRSRFEGYTIVVMNLINGSIGYLPPADLYDADVYSVWQTPFDRGSLEVVLETMAQAIQTVLNRE